MLSKRGKYSKLQQYHKEGVGAGVYAGSQEQTSDPERASPSIISWPHSDHDKRTSNPAFPRRKAFRSEGQRLKSPLVKAILLSKNERPKSLSTKSAYPSGILGFWAMSPSVPAFTTSIFRFLLGFLPSSHFLSLVFGPQCPCTASECPQNCALAGFRATMPLHGF